MDDATTRIKEIESNLDESSSSNLFECKLCNIYVKYDYYGHNPYEYYQNPLKQLITTNTTNKETIILLENVYTCKDPFSSSSGSNGIKFLQLGSLCSQCKQQICMSPQCSLFYYNKRFCIKCALETVSQFPNELKTEILRQQQQ